MSSILNVPVASIEQNNRLPDQFVFEWAEEQIKLTTAYLSGVIPSVSSTPELKKTKDSIMNVLEEKFSQNTCTLDKDKAIRLFSNRLEDPGMLKNFIYFDAINSDDMLLFFYHIWSGEMARSLEAVYGQGYDLYGNYRNCPKNESWYKMICYESMTINEREKAKLEVETIIKNNSVAISYLGGGIPHLHHFDSRACRDRLFMIFDNGYFPTEEELNRFNQNYDILKFQKHNLLQVADIEWQLNSTQDLVVMSGVSPYLYEAHKPLDASDSKMLLALENGNRLLKTGGLMMVDFLLPTVCMKRLALTQCWPMASSMRIFANKEDAIAEAKRLLTRYNEIADESISFNKGHFVLEETNINVAKPWGATSVYFTLRKT